MKKIFQTWWSSVGSILYTISCRGLCLNYLKKISPTWWSSVGSILQVNKLSWFVSELPEEISQTWWSSFEKDKEHFVTFRED